MCRGSNNAVAVASSSGTPALSVEARLDKLERVMTGYMATAVGGDSLGLILSEMRSLHGLLSQQTMELRTLQSDSRSQKAAIANLQAAVFGGVVQGPQAPYTPGANIPDVTNNAGQIAMKTPLTRYAFITPSSGS